MDLNALKIFVKTVRLNGISAAAQDLGLPKSTVSHKLKQLEEELGIRLLHRTTRKQVLTDEGQAFFQQVSRLMDELVEASQTLASRQLLPLGLIRLAAPIELSSTYLGTLLARFSARYPAVQLQIELFERMPNLVEEGYDLALCVGELQDSAFVCKKLSMIERKLVASPEYLRTNGLPAHPGDLATHRSLAHPNQLKSGGWEFRQGGNLQTHTLTVDFVANSFLILRDAARQNLGVAVLPNHLCSADLLDGRLIELMPDWKLDPEPLFAIYPSSRLLPTRVRKLIDYLGEHLR